MGRLFLKPVSFIVVNDIVCAWLCISENRLIVIAIAILCRFADQNVTCDASSGVCVKIEQFDVCFD